MILGTAVDATFASGLLAFGSGLVAVAGLGIALVGVIVWLLVANVLLHPWRLRTGVDGALVAPDELAERVDQLW